MTFLETAQIVVMFKRLFGAEKSGASGAPSLGTGGGGGGKTTPLGAVEQLKDVRSARSYDHTTTFRCRCGKSRLNGH